MCNIEHLLNLYQSRKVSFSASEDAMFDEIIALRKRVGELEEANRELTRDWIEIKNIAVGFCNTARSIDDYRKRLEEALVPTPPETEASDE